MSVDSRHPEYKENETIWKKCSDAFEGEDEIKEEGTTYLRRLSGQTDSEYLAYRDRAVFPEVVSRTVAGMLGQVFRKNPVADLDKMEAYWDDIDLGGKTITQFAYDAVLNVLKYGRFGILADFSTTENRPYIAAYDAPTIINWREERIQGKITPTMIVLAETMEQPKDDDEFEMEIVQRRRVLRLIDGAYIVEVWQKGDKDRDWMIVDDEDTIMPTRFGSPLVDIPFACVGPYGLGLKIQKPPILPLVNLNLSLYRTSADLENGRHFCGCPTPWVTGVQADDGPFRIGAPEAWVFSQPEARVGMLEFTGQGLGALETAWLQKIEMMGAFGAYMLTPQKKAAETAESKRIDATSEGSVLSAIVDSVSMAMTQALAMCNEWAGGSADVVKYQLNKDFWSARLSPQDVRELVASWQAGAFDHGTLLYNFREGEILNPETTDEEIMERLKMEDPVFSPVPSPSIIPPA